MKFKAVLSVDEDQLRDVWKGLNPGAPFNAFEAVTAELGWVNDSGIYLEEVDEVSNHKKFEKVPEDLS